VDKLLILKTALFRLMEQSRFLLSASQTKSGNRCKVTVMNCGSKHPYHLVSEDSKEVFGWVNSINVIK